ncbi:Imm1 family immunity protein [Streptomyces sp. 8K308]|uniref:Imm1 family immunity protein n=1 Tax=Streptomyces sp. 8K308 TaxID=2530388 RepID=UPI0014051DC4|nr:Imm1 family immunity protein [Streptomyces sp. 8K308]
MDLYVFLHGRWRRPASWSETERLITELIENSPIPEPRPVAEAVPEHVATGLRAVLAGLPALDRPYGGVTAEFGFAARQPGAADHLGGFVSLLRVVVNARTGHGALTWLVPQGSTARLDPSVADQVWISDNPTPPSVDPEVVADPCVPRYHHRRSTLPVGLLRAAVTEFCRSRTGDRPGRVSWTAGDLGGRRLDTPTREEYVTHCQDPWCENPEPAHPHH